MKSAADLCNSLVRLPQKSNGFVFTLLWLLHAIVQQRLNNEQRRQTQMLWGSESAGLSASMRLASPSWNGSVGSAPASWQAVLASSACQGPGLLNGLSLSFPDTALAERPRLPVGSRPRERGEPSLCMHAWKLYDWLRFQLSLEVTPTHLWSSTRLNDAMRHHGCLLIPNLWSSHFRQEEWGWQFGKLGKRIPERCKRNIVEATMWCQKHQQKTC